MVSSIESMFALLTNTPTLADVLSLSRTPLHLTNVHYIYSCIHCLSSISVIPKYSISPFFSSCNNYSSLSFNPLKLVVAICNVLFLVTPTPLRMSVLISFFVAVFSTCSRPQILLNSFFRFLASAWWNIP